MLRILFRGDSNVDVFVAMLMKRNLGGGEGVGERCQFD